MPLEWHDTSDLPDGFTAEWEELCRASSTPNLYLTPAFLLPALRHLDPDSGARLAVVRDGRSNEMHALVPLRPVPPSWRFPWPGWELWRGKHSFQAGVVFREGREDEAVDVLLEHVLDDPRRLLAFSELRLDTPAGTALRDGARRHGLTWELTAAYERASLPGSGMNRWREWFSASRHKGLAMARKHLNELGPVETRCLRGACVRPEAIDDFLRLESAGWKRSTSIRADPHEEAFFRELCDATRASGELLVCELQVGEAVIASTVNFIHRGRGFAFKIGWDPAYRRFSPGILTEYALLEAVERGELRVTHFDSGAQQGSYMEELWHGRTPIVRGHIARGSRARLFLSAARGGARLKRRARRMHGRLPTLR